MREAVASKIEEIAQRVTGSEGMELVEVEVKGGGNQRLVRVYIDKPEGVTHSDCETISHVQGIPVFLLRQARCDPRCTRSALAQRPIHTLRIAGHDAIGRVCVALALSTARRGLTKDQFRTQSHQRRNSQRPRGGKWPVHPTDCGRKCPLFAAKHQEGNS